MKRLLLFSAAASVLACGGPQDPNLQMTEGPMGPNLKGPRDGVYLRASFDDDPSHFMGRFISNDLASTDIDENRGVQTECSKFVTYKEVNSSGNYDEYYNSSTTVNASLGLADEGAAALGAAGSGNMAHESGTSLRVKYDISRKLVANVEDPTGFEACCNAAPGNCTDKYIGEFWYGKGQLYEKSGSATSGGGDVSGKGGAAGVEVADGWAWRKGTQFENVYFAFRVVDRVATDDCGWATQLPKSDAGQFFVGVSPPAPDEGIARQMAMQHARTQAVQYLGDNIKTQTTNVSSVVDGYIHSENVIMTAAEGIASFVKDDRYCAAETTPTPEGEKISIKVLAFFPNESIDAAKKATVDVVEKQMEADGKLTPAAKKELAAIRGQ